MHRTDRPILFNLQRTIFHLYNCKYKEKRQKFVAEVLVWTGKVWVWARLDPLELLCKWEWCDHINADGISNCLVHYLLMFWFNHPVHSPSHPLPISPPSTLTLTSAAVSCTLSAGYSVCSHMVLVWVRAMQSLWHRQQSYATEKIWYSKEDKWNKMALPRKAER